MKNKIIIFLILASFSGFGQITRTLPNVTNTADSMKPVSTVQKAAIVQKLQTVATISALQGFTDATIAQFDGSQWNKKSGNVASNGGTAAGTIINVSTSFYWERKYNNNIDVKWFGAIADGNYTSGAGTNNSVFIQNAVNYAFANNSGVNVSKGIYKCLVGIQIPDAMNFYGDGIWNTVLFCPTTFTDVNGLLNMNGTGGFPSTVSNLAVLSQNGGNTGTGINCTKNGAIIDHVWVNGYNVGVDINTADSFFTNFYVEFCVTGVISRGSHMNISTGEIYNCSEGLAISNNASTENANTLITDIRVTESLNHAFIFSNNCKNIVANNCHAYATNILNLTASGFLVYGTNIKMINCSSKYSAGTSTTGIGFSLQNSNNIQMSNCTANNHKIGARIQNCSNFKLSNSDFSNNVNYGIYCTQGDRIDINNNTCLNNGTAGATTDAGIWDENTAGYSLHKISNNTCSQIGGGVQDYGVYLSLTDNAATSGFTYLNGNVATSNSVGNITKVGLVANIINISTDQIGVFGLISQPNVFTGVNSFTQNLGIGITNAASPLTVSADNASVGQVLISGNSNTNKGLYLGYNTTGNYGVLQPLVNGTGYSHLILNPLGGGVGIATTAPTSKLHVVGLSTYADNTTALAAGLTAGAFYRTATGVLMVAF